MVKPEGCQWTSQHIPELPSVLQHMPNLTNLHLPEWPLHMELTQLQSLELGTLYSNRALKDLDSLQEMVVWNVIGCLVDENIFRSLGRELANLISLREVGITFYDATQMAQVLMELLANEHIRMRLDSITWRFTKPVTGKGLKWMAPEVLLHQGMEHLKKLHLVIPLTAKVYMYKWEKAMRSCLCDRLILPVKCFVVEGIHPTRGTQYLKRCISKWSMLLSYTVPTV